MKLTKLTGLKADELRAVAEASATGGIRIKIFAFVVIILLNVLPLFIKYPLQFTKQYIIVYLNNFIEEKSNRSD